MSSQKSHPQYLPPYPPSYTKGKLYFLDRRISVFTCFTDLPKTLSPKNVAYVRDYYWLSGYGPGVETTAMVLDDVLHIGKERYVQALICNSKGVNGVRYIPVLEFQLIITKRTVDKVKAVG